MKSFRIATVTLAGLTATLTSLNAQTNGTDQGQMAAHEHKIIAFLPPADQDRVIAAYDKAMADNPDLKADQMELQKERQSMSNDSDDQARHAFMDKVQAYQKKIRAAMLKEDPSLDPVLDQIDKHRAEVQARQERDQSSSGQ